MEDQGPCRRQLLLCVCLLLLWRGTEGGYVAQYGPDSLLSLPDLSEVFRYPDGDVRDNRSFFISELNFDLLEGTVATGAADQLVLLSESDLRPVLIYNWPVAPSNRVICQNPEDSPSSAEDPLFTCHNHIRVYQRLPGNHSQVLVCGTQAVVQPQCRLLNLSLGEGGVVEYVEYGAVESSPGLLSYYPQFPQFGQFRYSTEEDTVFMAAGFFDGDNGAGRHFSIAYKNITMETPSDPDTLETMELFRTISANNNWLTFPVTFVGLERADYPVPQGQPPADYQFWFIFLREKLVTDDVIYSRLARVCRNDPGSMATSDDAHYFTTFMKARIFCRRDKPSSLEFTDTVDFIYNSITSFVFSKEGRYYDDGGVAKRLLYGSFTGSSNGPVGSALCVYAADNSIETSPGAGSAGRTKSVFDVFREDISTAVTSNAVENTFVECDQEGRSEEDQQQLFIDPDVSVEQLGDDPILVLDDVIVNVLVQDTVCVVAWGNSSVCINQDVLFLGLDTGRVLKVVFGRQENEEAFPVIAEDIELDPNDPRNVTAMDLRVVAGEKFLFVSTDTRVYKLPVERCGRFPRCRCSDCVSSRDPYCVYNTESYTCEQNKLSPYDPVHSKYRQNIHSGIVDESCDCPVVDLTPGNVTVREGQGSVLFQVTSSRPVNLTVKTVSGTAGPSDYKELDLSLEVVALANITVNILDDVALETTQEFTLSLISDEVFFKRSAATITILDNDGVGGVPFSLLFRASQNCAVPLGINEVFTSDLINSLVSGILSKCECSDFTGSHITNYTILLSCSEGLWFLELQGQMLSTESSRASLVLLPALGQWAESAPPLAISGVTLTPYKICTVNDSPCNTASGLTGSSGPTYSEGDFAAVVVLLVIAVLVVVAMVVMVMVCWKRPSWESLNRRLSGGSLTSREKVEVPQPPHLPHTPRVNKSLSYEQANSENPCSVDSQTALVARGAGLEVVPEEGEEEPFPGFATPDTSLHSIPRSGIPVSQNVAYGGVQCDGNGEVDHSNKTSSDTTVL